jgi:hypothetical protein
MFLGKEFTVDKLWSDKKEATCFQVAQLGGV